MVSVRLSYTIAIVLVATLVPSYVSSQNGESSPEFPPSTPVEGGRTLEPADSTEPEEPVRPYRPWFRPHFHHRPRPFLPRVPFPNFGFIPFNTFWNYVYSKLSEFTTEACSSPENNGTCSFIFLKDDIDNGNETCGIYTVGNCDESIQSSVQRGCVHKCRLPCKTTEKPTVGGPVEPTLPPAGEPATEEPSPEGTPSEGGEPEEPTGEPDVPIEADEDNEP